MPKFYTHSSAIIDSNTSIGSDTKIWHFSHISRDVKIGSNCTLGQNVFIGEKVIIGDNCKIQNNVSIFAGILLEDDVFCGPSVVFTNVLRPRSRFPKNKNYEKTVISKGATLGANSTIICPRKIGKYSFVGAGSVVTQDLPNFKLFYGNPAIDRGWVCKCGNSLNLITSNVRCLCGREYHLVSGELVQK